MEQKEIDLVKQNVKMNSLYKFLGIIEWIIQKVTEFEHPFSQTAFISCDFKIIFVKIKTLDFW